MSHYSVVVLVLVLVFDATCAPTRVNYQSGSAPLNIKSDGFERHHRRHTESLDGNPHHHPYFDRYNDNPDALLARSLPSSNQKFMDLYVQHRQPTTTQCNTLHKYDAAEHCTSEAVGKSGEESSALDDAYGWFDFVWDHEESPPLTHSPYEHATTTTTTTPPVQESGSILQFDFEESTTDETQPTAAQLKRSLKHRQDTWIPEPTKDAGFRPRRQIAPHRSYTGADSHAGVKRKPSFTREQKVGGKRSLTQSI
jgi:hypothetical protein